MTRALRIYCWSFYWSARDVPRRVLIFRQRFWFRAWQFAANKYEKRNHGEPLLGDIPTWRWFISRRIAARYRDSIH